MECEFKQTIKVDVKCHIRDYDMLVQVDFNGNRIYKSFDLPNTQDMYETYDDGFKDGYYKGKKEAKEKYYSRGEDAGFAKGWDACKKFFKKDFYTKPKEIVNDFWLVLGIMPTKDIIAIEKAYKKMSLVYHPDQGGSNEHFIRLTKSKESAIKYATQTY